MSIREIIILIMYCTKAVINVVVFFAKDYNGDSATPFDTLSDWPILYYPLAVIYALAKPVVLCGLLYLIFC